MKDEKEISKAVYRKHEIICSVCKSEQHMICENFKEGIELGKSEMLDELERKFVCEHEDDPRYNYEDSCCKKCGLSMMGYELTDKIKAEILKQRSKLKEAK